MWFVRKPRRDPCGTIYRCWLVSKVPINRVEQLHGLLVRPNRVDDQREQSQAGEEEQALG